MIPATNGSKSDCVSLKPLAEKSEVNAYCTITERPWDGAPFFFALLHLSRPPFPCYTLTMKRDDRPPSTPPADLASLHEKVMLRTAASVNWKKNATPCASKSRR